MFTTFSGCFPIPAMLLCNLLRYLLGGVTTCFAPPILVCMLEERASMLQKARGCGFPLLICLAVAAMVVMGLVYSFRGTISKNKSAVIQLVAIEPSKRTKAMNSFQSEPLVQNPSLGCTSVTGDMVRAWDNPVNSLYPAPAANCLSLESGSNKTELNRIKKLLTNWKAPLSDDQFLANLSDCAFVKRLFSDYYYVSDSERNFPLGFVITMHTAPQQVVRFLRVVYRPHNVYCIHPDAKAGKKLADGLRQLTSCLPNVVVPDQLLSVTYKHVTIMESQLLCVNKIQERFPNSKWRYMLILCGRELPFSSNQEIVNVLKNKNGASLIGPHDPPRKEMLRRMTYKNIVDPKGRLRRIRVKVGKPPHNIKIYKSSNYIVLTREFMNFLFTNKKAKDFRRYIKDVRIPEEYFFGSLYKLPEAPKGRGGANGKVIVAKQYWTWSNNLRSCPGKVVHYMCILTTPDLPRIFDAATKHSTTYFFFNKYFMEDDPVIMDCLERRILAQNIKDYNRDCKPR